MNKIKGLPVRGGRPICFVQSSEAEKGQPYGTCFDSYFWTDSTIYWLKFSLVHFNAAEFSANHFIFRKLSTISAAVQDFYLWLGTHSLFPSFIIYTQSKKLKNLIFWLTKKFDLFWSSFSLPGEQLFFKSLAGEEQLLLTSQNQTHTYRSRGHETCFCWRKTFSKWIWPVRVKAMKWKPKLLVSNRHDFLQHLKLLRRLINTERWFTKTKSEIIWCHVAEEKSGKEKLGKIIHLFLS